ncbi:MAG: hypothetical protein KF799_07285 [Bdellovibrionales bacterium]|nr:hypothetical protein [Bdellovibrionales bacterium]
MNRKDLLWFLGLEVFAVIWAGAVFSLFSSRVMAGAFAGTYFVLSGAYIAYRVWTWSDKWASPTWYAVLAHLFGISLPLVITRFLNVDTPFEQVRILGLEGPEFHRLSTTVFSLLMVSTVLDLVRVHLKTKKKGLRERNP